MAVDPPPVKDVEAVLLKERPRLRRPGEVIYPLEYNHEMISFDNWNHMFLVSCFRGLTMSAVHPPPSTVLDLGCGGGLWALEAAKQWPNSTVIGFDIKDIQPRLNKYIDPRQENFWQRVTWVHGNLLDGLPFPPDYFDFVRIAGLGLAVPEDEEVARVMKPRGTLEIIEEDLIFPTGPVPKPRPRPPPISVDLPPSLDSMPTTASSKAPSTFSSKDNPPWGISFEDPPPLTLQQHTKAKPSLAPVHEIVFPLTDVPVSSILPTPLARRLHTRSLSSQLEDMDMDVAPHPQDHSKLLAAWDAMLSRRFLSPQLTTVLPFYLSSFFDDVQTHAPLLIKIPPNSRALTANGSRGHHEHTSSVGSGFEPGVFALSSSTGRRSGETGNSQLSNSPPTTSTSAWAPMHLARCVATATACKEAIWEEYQRMYDDDLPPVLNVVGGRSKASSSRETFEADWTSWENDMLDRIGSRRLLQREFAWPEPETERPEWRVWRSNLDIKAASSGAAASQANTELCRSMRGFVAIKPAVPSTPLQSKLSSGQREGKPGSSSNSTKSAESSGSGSGRSSKLGSLSKGSGKPGNLSIPAVASNGSSTPDTPRPSNVASTPRPASASASSKAATSAASSANPTKAAPRSHSPETPRPQSKTPEPPKPARSPTPTNECVESSSCVFRGESPVYSIQSTSNASEAGTFVCHRKTNGSENVFPDTDYTSEAGGCVQYA
ncbi:hypothetical protein K525DRAFT_250178 [Schizophyllum commune Loenen D]|nr:hypothetical protein K525DRAFT_250178 [Schizophyllum commune Loenen D]